MSEWFVLAMSHQGVAFMVLHVKKKTAMLIDE